MTKSRLIKRILPFLVCICVVGIEICSFSINAYANESLEVGASETTTYTLDIDESYIWADSSNTSMPVEYYESAELTSSIRKIHYYYHYFGAQTIFTASEDVYAYRVHVSKPSGYSADYHQISSRRFVLGTLDEIIVGDCEWGSYVAAANAHNFWYVNNYSTMPIRLGVMAHCYGYSEYEIDENGAYSLFEKSDASYMTLKGSWTVTITAYSKDDYLDEIYNELVTQSGQNEEIIAELTEIKNSNATIETKVSQMYTLMNSYLPSISTTLRNIYSYMQTYFVKFDSKFDTMIEHLETIAGAVTEGEDDPPPENVSKDEMTGVLDGEDALLDKDTSSSEESLDVEIDATANTVVWDIVTDFLQANAKVFGVYISALSLGVICLILNR